jgi:RNA polymerase sigma-70 factor (ECF subfamily)
VDERDLVERVLRGDEAAERMLFRSHVERVYRLAYRLTGEEDLAQDCAQETFVRAFERLSTFRGEARLSTWISRIALSVTLNRLRARRRIREREVALPDHDFSDEHHPQAHPFVRARIERAMQALPEETRVAVVMHHLEGYSHEEIAAVFGVSVAASKTRLSRARARLRDLLADLAPDLTP